VVRRFSSKEEKRRVMANVVNPADFPGMTLLGFENHLNVFHANKQGLHKTLAYGLMVFLNSTALDEYFRTFNGHTQVNATDLKQIKYPSREILMTLGEWALNQLKLTQEMIDEKLEAITA
jgi:adenine-specific DNA-methyltransferase